MHARAPHEQTPELRTHLAQEPARCEPFRIPLGASENAHERAVIRFRGVELIALALAPVVLAQCAVIVGERLDDVARKLERTAPFELAHRRVDALELRERGPARILAPPA